MHESRGFCECDWTKSRNVEKLNVSNDRYAIQLETKGAYQKMWERLSGVLRLNCMEPYETRVKPQGVIDKLLRNNPWRMGNSSPVKL